MVLSWDMVCGKRWILEIPVYWRCIWVRLYKWRERGGKVRRGSTPLPTLSLLACGQCISAEGFAVSTLPAWPCGSPHKFYCKVFYFLFLLFTFLPFLFWVYHHTFPLLGTPLLPSLFCLQHSFPSAPCLHRSFFQSLLLFSNHQKTSPSQSLVSSQLGWLCVLVSTVSLAPLLPPTIARVQVPSHAASTTSCAAESPDRRP